LSLSSGRFGLSVMQNSRGIFNEFGVSA
jgi:hypothetical protein